MLGKTNPTTSNLWRLWSSAGLEMPIQVQFYPPAIWTRKVGHGDLAFDVWSGFASGCSRFKVCAYNG